ncbi:RagB/SusD family nutrient uptake outer membrane protein [Parafilimonas sp.]|uniref:RagB/SusD family nutrient uptake outer membrane protein n=1 Tax=Parafilimonas sp. TaxID=1969739 RepID=UPI0039E5F386
MNKFFSFIIVGLCFIAVSCKKELDKQPTTTLSNTTYWQTEQDAVSAVNNIYRYLGDVDYESFISCATDDSYSWSNWPNDVQYVGNGSATSSTSYFEHFWSHFYTMIAAANDVTDNIDKVSDISADMLARLKGEARFLRAYAYQQLTGMYGDVPLITHIQSTEEFNVARTSKDSVVQFIISELDDIADDLPSTYSSSDEGRITKGAALALKARVELYNDSWADAATDAKAVMDMGVYSIDDDYLSLFNGTNKTSPEIILSAQYIKSTYPSALATWIGGPTLGGWSQIVPLQKLVDAYECTDGKTIGESPLYDADNPFDNRDPRLKLTIVIPGTEVNGETIDITQSTSIDALGNNNASFSGYYYKKYVPADISGDWYNNSYNDIVLLRYAEVLLTYAEAKVEAGEIDQSVYDAINKVRQRSGVDMPAVTQITAGDQSSLRSLIRRERHVEFAVEDNRFFDIRRWKIAEDVMPGPAYGILNNFNSSRADYNSHVLVEQRNFNTNRDYLFAIPANELSINTALVQNSNW